ncbi:MAG: hypothetical protein AB1758_22415 [Candidatus Eremiobacterota bacterium]
MTVTSKAAAPSYAERVRIGRLKGAIYAGVAALDLYAAGATTLAPAGSPFPLVCGLAAVSHAAYSAIKFGLDYSPGYLYFFEFKDRNPADRLAGLGHAITALGFVGLAAGMGGLALPVVILGEVAAITGDWFSSQLRK